MAKAKRDERTTRAADRAPRPPAQRGTVTNSDIARRAYDLYLAGGGEHGHDVDDWIQAERELRGTTNSSAV